MEWQSNRWISLSVIQGTGGSLNDHWWTPTDIVSILDITQMYQVIFCFHWDRPLILAENRVYHFLEACKEDSQRLYSAHSGQTLSKASDISQKNTLHFIVHPMQDKQNDTKIQAYLECIWTKSYWREIITFLAWTKLKIYVRRMSLKNLTKHVFMTNVLLLNWIALCDKA